MKTINKAVTFAAIFTALALAIYIGTILRTQHKHEALGEKIMNAINVKHDPELGRQLCIEYILSDPHMVNVIVDNGTTYMIQNKFKNALPYFQIATDLGSEDAAKYLAACDIQLDQLDDFRDHLPQIEKAAKGNVQTALLMALYACKTINRDLFLKSVAMVNDGFFAANPDELQFAIEGASLFKLSDLERKYAALKKTTEPSGQP